jgi:hypothetical protein
MKLVYLFFAMTVAGCPSFAPPPAQGTVVPCGTSNQCNNLGPNTRPPCAALTCNVCKDRYCVWQVDPTQSQCKCIPGTLRRCTEGGISTCNAQGTDWGTCQ